MAAAATGTGLKVEGLSKVISRVRRMGVETADLKDAFEPMGRAATTSLRAAAPHRTGKLAGSHRPLRRANKVQVKVGGRGGINYAHFVIFGTSRMAPNPYHIGVLAGLPLDSYVNRAIATAITKAGLRSP